MLKGYLLKETQTLDKGHSLAVLGRKLQNIDFSFRRFAADLGFMNQFYIETRYPADIPIMTKVEIFEKHQQFADQYSTDLVGLCG